MKEPLFDARVVDCDPEQYHARPGLSASIAATLIARSPLHAWSQHPAYGGKGKKATKAMDEGTIGHRLVLGKGRDYRALDFDDYRTNAAKAARDAAIADGFVPVLAERLAELQQTADAIRIELARHRIQLDGQSELCIEWHEKSESGPVLCRAMLDHVWLERGRILDLKLVADAAPAKVERSAENFGYAIQHAAYTRALAALMPNLAGRVEMLFAFCEKEAPHAVNVCRPDGVFRALGEARWVRAVETWGACVKNNAWPGYGEVFNTLSAPTWALHREEAA